MSMHILHRGLTRCCQIVLNVVILSAHQLHFVYTADIFSTAVCARAMQLDHTVDNPMSNECAIHL